MSDAANAVGARIAAARRQRGLALDVLATQLKIPVARLEALEQDRWDQLPDATHARALATSVCRALDLDPAPTLAAMPRGKGAALDRVSQGLNQPVRSGNGNVLPMGVWIGLLLLGLAAAAFWSWPVVSTWLPQRDPAAAPAVEAVVSPGPAAVGVAAAPEGASAASALMPSAASAPEVVSAPPAPVQAPASAQVAGEPALLEIRAANGASWVSVNDASGASLAAQLLNTGESLSLNPNAALPLRVVLGNAPVLELRWRGQAQLLDGYEQRRVAKLELK